MQELGLDGPRALPAEVRVSFQQRAQGILEAAPRQQAANASWLDLVMLCLCAEVIRNLKVPDAASGSTAETVDVPSTTASSTSAPWQMTAIAVVPSPRPLPGSNDPFVLQRHWVVPPSDNHRHWVVPASDHHGRSVNIDPISIRLDRDFLRDRVFVLMENLLGGGLPGASRPAGLTIEEMDLHCPVANRQSINGDDSCPICLEPCILGEPIRCLPCNHELHKECIEAWLATADTCPTCRYQVPRSQVM
jgi:hypothetical protein